MREEGKSGRSFKLEGRRGQVKAGTDVVRRGGSPYNRAKIRGMRPSEVERAGTAGSRNRRPRTTSVAGRPSRSRACGSAAWPCGSRGRPHGKVACVGRRVEAVRRRGKWIVLELDDGGRLVVHLGMTGQLTVASGRGADKGPYASAFRPRRRRRTSCASATCGASAAPRCFRRRRGWKRFRRRGPGAGAVRPRSRPTGASDWRRPRASEGGAARSDASWPASATSTPTRRCSRRGCIRA